MGEVVAFRNGKTRPKTAGKYPIFGGNGILGSADQYNSDGERIIVGRVGAYCGSVYYANEKIWVTDNALMCKPSNGKNYKFIYYLLKSMRLNEYAEGSSHPLLTQTLLNSIEVEIPLDDDQQQIIASVLSSLDDKIDLLQRQNQTLEALAQTIFRKWFVEEEGDDWEEGVIPDEFDFTMGLSPPGSSYNENETGIPMFQGNKDFGFRFPTNRVYTTDPRRFAEKFDTLISVRAPVGAQNMAFEKCCIGRGVAAFRYQRDKSYYSYTYYKLRSLMDEIRMFDNEGTVFGSIGKRDFMSLEIIVPPNDLVDLFQSTVNHIDEKIILNINQIRTLESLRDTLLPKLISGEVRVQI